MNNRGSAPTITWIVIGLAVFIAVIALANSAYQDFALSNGVLTHSPGYDALNNISNLINDNSKDSLNGINTQLRGSDGLFGIVTSTVSGIGSTLNAFMIGFGALSLLLRVPQLLTVTFTSVTAGFGGVIPYALSWLILFVITFYVIMKMIQAYRGTINPP